MSLTGKPATLIRVLMSAAAVLLAACEFGVKSDDGAHSGNGNDTTATLSASDLRLTNEASGWSEESGSYIEFDVQGLYDLIDGGAVPHEEYGLVEGIYQTMTGPSGRTAEIYVEDMDNAANAKELFDYQAQNAVSQKVTFPDFAEAAAVASQHLSGITVFAYFGQFYLNVNLMGYTDAQTATTDGNGFLKTYQNKIQ
jgi:hypothetical protein